jgi:hypothetical protein
MDQWQPLDSLEDYSALFLDESFDIFGCVNFDADLFDPPSYDTIPAILPDTNIGWVDESSRCPASAESFSENVEPLNSLQSIDGYFAAEEQISVSQSPPIPFRGPPNLIGIDRGEILNIGCMPDPSEPEKLKTKKLKWNKSIIVFPSKADSKKTPRQRKTFDKARRKEVALTRRVGACIQCKLKKASVSILRSILISVIADLAEVQSRSPL